MANLRKCTRCKSEIDISYFGMNRKQNHIKHVIIVGTQIRKSANQLTQTQTSLQLMMKSRIVYLNYLRHTQQIS